MTAPYYEADGVTLYVGDMRDVLPALDITADLILADPPYGDTKLEWDQWPDGWLNVAAQTSRSLWCFGSMRMFLQHTAEFTAGGWKLSQDVVWEKEHGSGYAADRFRRVHENATHWYRGDWSTIHHETPRTKVHYRTQGNTGRGRVPAMGDIGSAAWSDDGTRLLRSVLQAPSMWRRGAIHPTQKPSGIIQPLLEYACPVGGLVIDPFAGSGSTLVAARLCGRRAIGVEADEEYAERAAHRLAQAPLDFGEAIA